MDRKLLEFNPQREQLAQSLLRLRKEYPDSFPGAWAASGESFRNLGAWEPNLDSRDPEAALEMVCMAHRFWLMMATPPTLDRMGPMVKGMILVNMERLGERPPSLASLMGIDDDEEELDEDDFISE